jgi:deazaflavin-dependent oxidoreductase (nitroreductase family)
MVFSKRMARFNRMATNHVLGPLTRRLPSFGVVAHRGRRSGRSYQTPVGAFHTADGFAIALTYGPHTDWVRNVLAAGGCDLETRGQRIPLIEPRIVRDQTRRAAPFPHRQILKVIGADQFMYLKKG